MEHGTLYYHKSYFGHSSSMQSGWHCDNLLLHCVYMSYVFYNFTARATILNIKSTEYIQAFSVAHVYMCFLASESGTHSCNVLSYLSLLADMKSCGSLSYLPWMSDHVATSGLKA